MSGTARPWMRPSSAGAASLGCLTLAAWEEACWRLLGRPGEARPLIVVALGLAVIGGLGAATARRFLSPRLATILALFPVAAYAAHHVLRHRIPGASAVLLALPVGIAGAVVTASLALRPWGFLVLLASLSLPLVARPAMGPVPPALPAVTPAAGLPDIVLIVMDTTRRDRLSAHGHTRPTSPALEALAREAEVYEDAWAVAPWTPPSHASLLTGLLPAQHGVDGQALPPFPDHLVTLPGVLKRAGYTTGGFVANPLLTVRGWARDFDTYRTPWYGGSHSLIRIANLLRDGSAVSRRVASGWEVPDSTTRTLATARAWWHAEAGRPRFAFVNVLDPHHPYDPPSEYRARFLAGSDPREALAVPQDTVHYFLKPGLSARQKQLLGALYDAEIASMDREIGLFVEWLRSRKELDRTILVVTSDHGERLGERGLVGHDLVMDPYLLRVPLLVRYPPSVAPSRVKRRVQLDGLPGYIARLARVPCTAAMDENALDRQDRKIVVAQYQDPAWFTRRLIARNPGLDVRQYSGDWFLAADGRFVYVCSQTGGDSHDCVLNDSLTDPDWNHDARGDHPAVVEELKKALGRLPTFRPARARPIERDLLERVRSLGYLE